MEFNKNCKLFLKDIFLYDISACHYNILKRLDYDVSKIPSEKFERNKYIGLMMRENPRLINVLRGITESTISEYLLINHISEEDILLRQYDGVITCKPLKILNLSMPLDLRHSFSYFIISSHKQWYIAIDSNNEILIKGVPYRYDSMDEIYKKILNINYLSKSEVFKNLQKIKDIVLSSEDPSLYCIPINDDKFNVFLKNYGEVSISSSIIRILDTEDIDKQKYFDFYVRPFTESICIEFL